ncbi:MAG TPA: VOC family protein [Actinomycetota bacterium]|nr:VOC family protein [Actinomycetota bacterium]
MITGVRSVGIYVSDQDRAKKFWMEHIGLQLIQDTPMGEGAGVPRWIEVAPEDKSVVLVLFTPEGAESFVGTFSNVIFHCDDIQKTYEELTGKGVEFQDIPRKEFWGWWATFKDSDGNTYGLGHKD